MHVYTYVYLYIPVRIQAIMLPAGQNVTVVLEQSKLLWCIPTLVIREVVHLVMVDMRGIMQITMIYYCTIFIGKSKVCNNTS